MTRAFGVDTSSSHDTGEGEGDGGGDGGGGDGNGDDAGDGEGDGGHVVILIDVVILKLDAVSWRSAW